MMGGLRSVQIRQRLCSSRLQRFQAVGAVALVQQGLVTGPPRLLPRIMGAMTFPESTTQKAWEQ